MASTAPIMTGKPGRPPKRIYKAKEVCDMLDCSWTTLRDAKIAGMIPQSRTPKGQSKPIAPGDVIELTHQAHFGRPVTLLSETITEPTMVDAVAIFDVEPGDLAGFEGGIGGAFLRRTAK
jgi:hypothetical protein